MKKEMSTRQKQIKKHYEAQVFCAKLRNEVAKLMPKIEGYYCREPHYEVTPQHYFDIVKDRKVYTTIQVYNDDEHENAVIICGRAMKKLMVNKNMNFKQTAKWIIKKLDEGIPQ